MFKRVACGVSGGVDSAVAAALLKRRGFEVIGVFMKNWDHIEETGNCPQNRDLEDAKTVCHILNIPLKEVNFVEEYWTDVFENFLESYKNGRTPNPDVLCNRYIKFDQLFDYATDFLNADALATGHYAKSSFGKYLDKFDPVAKVKLLRPKDKFKDQTLFLSSVKQKALRKTMFPSSSYLKPEVKRLAIQFGFEKLSEKKESVGMCFIGKRKFHQFISQYLPNNPGNIVDIDSGAIVGHHKGTHNYTCGQNVAIDGALCKYYVAMCDGKSNEVIVCNDSSHRSLYCKQLRTASPVWIEENEPEELSKTDSMNCSFIFQRFALPFPCKILKLQNRRGLQILSDYPAKAPAVGQFVVFYKNDECLGSAEIVDKGPSIS